MHAMAEVEQDLGTSVAFGHALALTAVFWANYLANGSNGSNGSNGFNGRGDGTSADLSSTIVAALGFLTAK